MTDNKKNPWRDRLPVNATDSELIAGMRLSVPPIQDLESLPTKTAAMVLDTHLASIHEPTQQGLDFVRCVLETADAHAMNRYESVGHFMRNLLNNHDRSQIEPVSLMCSGDAGVGKSEIAKAMQRLLGDSPVLPATVNHPELPIFGGIFLRLEVKSTGADLLNQVATAVGMEGNFEKVTSRVKKLLRKALYRYGVLFILLDEAQQMAQGKTAGAAYTKNLLLLRELDVPLFYICNFSMVHGMLEQHPQNRQRLLVDPFVFERFTPEGPEFESLLAVYKQACGPILNIDLAKDLFIIHQLTDGRGRPLRLLIGAAYAMQRRRGEKQVCITVSDLQEAYCDKAYGVLRYEIEELQKHRADKRGLRKDLYFPPELDRNSVEHADMAAKQILRNTLAKLHLTSSLSTAEKKAGTVLAPEVPTPPAERRIGKPSPAKQAPKAEVPPKSPPPRSKRSKRGDISDQDISDVWGS